MPGHGFTVNVIPLKSPMSSPDRFTSRAVPRHNAGEEQGTESMVRPNAIVWFERLYLVSSFVWLVSLAANWGAVRDRVAIDPASQRLGVDTVMNIFIAILALVVLVTLLLWYFAARQNSIVAKWAIVILFVISLLWVPATIGQLGQGNYVALLQLAVVALNAGAVWMLFQRDARIWFGEIGDVPPAPPAPLA